MKNKVLLLLAAIVAFSCSQEKKENGVLSGKIENSPNGMVTLVGSDYEKDVILNDDGSFATELELPYDGYYNAIFGRIPLALYLEKGKDLSLNVDLQQFGESLNFEKDLAPENTFLAEKQKLSQFNLQELYKQEAEEFTTSIENLKEELKRKLESSAITNTSFLESQEKEFLYQQAGFLNTYKEAYGYLTETEEVNLPDNFYNAIEGIDLSDTLSFRKSDLYKQVLHGHLSKVVDEMPDVDGLNENLQYIELVNENFPAGYAKNQLLKNALGYNLKPDNYLDKVYKLYMANQTDPQLRQTMEDKYAGLSKITPGNESPSFDYENFKGGTTSLESLKGKFVYIDVWATWCLPCLKEAPHLKEIEKDYQDKKIAFVAISIDEGKDYEKWKEMVEEKELVGIQLYSGGDAWQSEFPQGYLVNSIPRFILIDPEGKIYDADTYRPSDNKLRELFNEIL